MTIATASSMDAAAPAHALGATGGERELIERAMRDPAAFGSLYRMHYASVAGCLYRRTGDAHAAEDLAAETFISAFRAIRRYRFTGAPFRHWLLRIATNKAARWSRRRLFAPLPESGAPGDDGAPAQRDRARLLNALARLGSAQQAAVSLHYFEGLSVEQVGAALGWKVGTVKSRLARARRALRELLDDGGGS